MPRSALQRFVALEASGGIVLFAAACAALIVANSPLATLYARLLDLPLSIRVGGFGLEKPLLLWIDDGLMAIFFMLVGLEVKREIVEGELSNAAQSALPVIAALGGMAGPALVYIACNREDPQALRGWAIPTATDIAFALGVLALLGRRVPPALKTFLLALAIADDLGAIVIIAAFYTLQLSPVALILALIGIVLLLALNRTGVSPRAPYLLVGLFLWVCVLKSGIHATLAGVVVGLSVPLRAKDASSPLRRLEQALHSWVAFGVLPVFAFANAGMRFAEVSPADLLQPVQLGIALGLFFGKQCGVLASTWVATRLGLAALPAGVRWPQIYGSALLTGIGFTMSLFIGSLAFPAPAYDVDVRLAVLAGSTVSAICGYAVLRAVSAQGGEPPPPMPFG